MHFFATSAFLYLKKERKFQFKKNRKQRNLTSIAKNKKGFSSQCLIVVVVVVDVDDDDDNSVDNDVVVENKKKRKKPKA